MKNNRTVHSLLCCTAILIVSGTGSLRPMMGCVPPSEEDMKRMTRTITIEEIEKIEREVLAAARELRGSGLPEKMEKPEISKLQLVLDAIKRKIESLTQETEKNRSCEGLRTTGCGC